MLQRIPAGFCVQVFKGVPVLFSLRKSVNVDFNASWISVFVPFQWK
jgi:hypothetical protein